MTDAEKTCHRCQTCEFWFRRNKEIGECTSQGERKRQLIRPNTRYSTAETDPPCSSWTERKKVPF